MWRTGDSRRRGLLPKCHDSQAAFRVSRVLFWSWLVTISISLAVFIVVVRVTPSCDGTQENSACAQPYTDTDELDCSHQFHYLSIFHLNINMLWTITKN